MSRFWSAPLFWIGLYLVGFAGDMAVHLIPALRSKLLPVPTWLRTLTLIPLLAPLFALPFVPQPRLAWPSVIGWFIGVPLLIAAAVIGLWALREIGLRPSWKPKGLVTTGIYGIVQHPIYLSIILFAFGWALGFRAIYALLFVPLVVTSYIMVVLTEERDLGEEYGENYREYTERVPWRLIPGVF